MKHFILVFASFMIVGCANISPEAMQTADTACALHRDATLRAGAVAATGLDAEQAAEAKAALDIICALGAPK